MLASDVLSFLYDIYYSLLDVGARLLDFLQEQPLIDYGYDWSWGGVIFGTAVFAYLAYAIIVWLIP